MMIPEQLKRAIEDLPAEDLPRLLLAVAQLNHTKECQRAKTSRAVSAVRVGPHMVIYGAGLEAADVLQKIMEEFQSRFGGYNRRG